MAQVNWSAEAATDLEGIFRFIARDSPAAAEMTIERIREAARRLMQFPMSGRAVPEAGDREVREIIAAPFRVIYRVRGNEIQVVTVVHGARDIG